MNAVNRSSKVRMKKNPFDLAIWRLLVILTRSILVKSQGLMLEWSGLRLNGFNAIPVKIQIEYFLKIDKLILKCIQKSKGPRIAKLLLTMGDFSYQISRLVKNLKQLRNIDIWTCMAMHGRLFSKWNDQLSIWKE